MRVVFFDLETGGLDWDKHPIIQIAAVAVDEGLNEIASFERKVLFNVADADPEALSGNSYDSRIWELQGIEPVQMERDFTNFLKRYPDLCMISKRTGRPYYVAQLAGHNAATFDFNFLQALYTKLGKFLPGSYAVLDTVQRFRWHFHENQQIGKPVDLKLGSLCEYFGVPLDDAHDALADVRATVAIYRKLVESEH